MKKLLKILKSMYHEGSEGNYLIIVKDPYYIQLNGGKKEPKIFIDAVSNDHLSEEDKLSDAQIKEFFDIGFEEENRSNNLSKEMEFSESNFVEIDKITIKALEIYGIDPYKADFELEIE